VVVTMTVVKMVGGGGSAGADISCGNDDRVTYCGCDDGCGYDGCDDGCGYGGLMMVE
jgi:hypothetical protein